MKKTRAISIGLLITTLLSLQAMAAAPIWDPSTPSRYVSARTIYTGQQLQVPAASSSNQNLELNSRLGGEWPSRPTDDIYAERLTGYATLDKLAKNKYPSKSDVLSKAAQKGKKMSGQNYAYDKNLPANKRMKIGYVTETQITGKLSRFPAGVFTPKFSGRWVGPATTPTYKSDLTK